MPAPKRQQTSQDPQTKRRKLDQNEVAMPSNKMTPAAATSSKPHREGPSQRRSKKKSPAQRKDRNKPSKSGRHSSKTRSAQKATTRTKSNPPVKNAKLPKATSTSSNNPNSKGTLKRSAKISKTASTESDEELIRTRKPDCIRKYSNGDRGKRKGAQTNPNEAALPSDPVQMDHNYGIPPASRGSHSECDQSQTKGVAESTRSPESQIDVKMGTPASSVKASDPVPKQPEQVNQSSETQEMQGNSVTTPTDEVNESVETKPETQIMSPAMLASSEKASDPILEQLNQSSEMQGDSVTTPTNEVNGSVETKPDTQIMFPPAILASSEKASDPIPEQLNQSSETQEMQGDYVTIPTDEVNESVETKPDTQIMSPPAILASSEKASDPIHEQLNQSSETQEMQGDYVTTPTDEVTESVETKPDTQIMSPPAILASSEKASGPIHEQLNHSRKMQGDSVTTPTEEVNESVEIKPDTQIMSPLAILASSEKASDPIPEQLNQSRKMQGDYVTTPTDEVNESVETKPDTQIMSPPAILASSEKASDPIHEQLNQSSETQEMQGDYVTTPTDEVTESVENKPDTQIMSPPAILASSEKASDPIHEQLNKSSEMQGVQEGSVITPTVQVNESVESKLDACIKCADPVSEQSTKMQENATTTPAGLVEERLETKVNAEILSPPAKGLVAYSSSSDSECESEENERKAVEESRDVTMETQVSSEKVTDPVHEQVKQSSTSQQIQEDSMTTSTYEVREGPMTTPSESVDTKLDTNIKSPSIEAFSEDASDPVPEQVNQICIEIEDMQKNSMTTSPDEVVEHLDTKLDAKIDIPPPLEVSFEETHTVEVSESAGTTLDAHIKGPHPATVHVMQSTEMREDSAPTPADQVSESLDTKLDIEVKSPPPVEVASEETSDNVSEQVKQSAERQEVQEDTMTIPTDKPRESLETMSGAKIKSPPLEALFSALKESSLCKHPLSDTMRSNVKEFLEVEDSLEIMNKDCDFGVTESIECTLDLETPIIVEDMEIGHCVVEVVGENGEDVDMDSDLEIIDNSKEVPEKTVQLTKGSEEDFRLDNSEAGTENKGTRSSNQDSTNSGKKEVAKKTQCSPEKPKKQQMNPQARTKARLAALAEQKAAASKKASRQLNLLALCEEIADDIATDTMLLKTEEEDEQVVTVEAEPSKEPECPQPFTQTETVPIPPTPAGPKEPSTPVAPVAAVSAPAKPPAPETPQRRFFISQVTVPLKIHEKKKLTRFQRLRQVELQREKNMSWTMVKKLKSDQANQKMFPETEVKPAPPLLSTPAVAAPIPVTTTPSPPSASPAAPTVTAPCPTPSAASPAVTPKLEPPKVEPPKVTPSKGPTLRKRTLPAVPPPMPNGLKAQKAKPVAEYKPYKARPKYSFDDFQLDDEPKPTVQKAVLPTVQRTALRPTSTTIPKAAVTLTTAAKHEDSKPTGQKTAVPTMQKPGVPTGQKTAVPTGQKTAVPTGQKTAVPTGQKTAVPTGQKTAVPTGQKTAVPTGQKTAVPTGQKTAVPTGQKTAVPTGQKTAAPTGQKTAAPTGQKTAAPTGQKTAAPTGQKTAAPTGQKTATPTMQKTATPTMQKTATPTMQKTATPTMQKTATPTMQKTAVPTAQKPAVPTSQKTAVPTAQKPAVPTAQKPAVPTAQKPAVPTPQKIVVPTTQKTAPTVQEAVVTNPTVQKAVETPTPMPGNEDSKLTVLKAEVLNPTVQKETLVPTLTPQTEQKAEASPTPKTAKDKDSIAPVSSPPFEETPRDSVDKDQCEEKPAVAEIKPASPEVKTEGTTTTESSDSVVVQSADNSSPLSDTCLQKEIKKLKEADKDDNQTTTDAGQKHFGAVTCGVCGMLYSAANPEDESQHLHFHNQFISAVRYVGWKKERILGEYPDGKIILVLPDDPKYALKKVEEIREMVDNDLGFQQVETKCPSQTKTFLFISNDKKVAGCLIAEHIQEGYRVIEEAVPEGSEGEKVMFERQRAWCCSTDPEPALCGISRIWVFSMMRRTGIASRMIECLRNNFIYGSYLSKEEIAFSDPTPDGKLFATHYCGTSQFLVYNFVSGTRSDQPSLSVV
uniref:nascent polypeptide-associated complex subunit alpha, muscle-specific form-like n=1 Tax=Oncorhynchus gorbuscha TaxID=8017 RepID=UPI001EAED047|nr:nascent polypeptide-associated complex subunit alpha, muscle-specific form-like [Oncorhynchus gorbuscha]XP_046212088.1 nascent polypeptide-associated complex subunit alpha, muscle-specific form-like [Oncorhynchus gorbuscha]